MEIAISALQHGLDGTALQQLAGLSRPTLDDLGNLPARVFADMGLKPIDRDGAVAVLLSRGEPSTSPAISTLRQAFPDFSDRWKKHITFWGGNPPGSYNDMAEFVHFVVEDVYEKGKLDETRRIFQLLEELLVEADQESRNLIGLGFFETLQNVASWRPHGNKVYEQFFGPMSKQVWSELRTMWTGKSSLMDERTSPFTSKSVFVCLVLRPSVDDHGSSVIFRSASVRPKHLFDLNFNQDYSFKLPFQGAGCPIIKTVFYCTPCPIPSCPAYEPNSRDCE
ncbi:MAG: hypothetical protein WA581_17005 [Candidatus Acidiferrales bacterium]